MPKIVAKFQWNHPQLGRQIYARQVKTGYFRLPSRYISEIFQDKNRVGANEGLETHMRFIEWWYFQ